MTTKRAKQLAEAITAGKLRRTQANAETVKAAWVEAVKWNQLFKEAGLEWLPDPENTQGYEVIFESWIVKAYTCETNSEEQVRAAWPMCASK